MAKTIDDLYSMLSQINDNLLNILSTLQNAPGINIKVIPIVQANSDISIPEMNIPDNFSVLIKAGDQNSGNIFLYNYQDHQNPDTLIAGQFRTLRITDFRLVSIQGDTAGDTVLFEVEQK